MRLVHALLFAGACASPNAPAGSDLSASAVTDLARPSADRWPAFAGPVLDAGARAVFGFPLQVGTVRLGALNLYRDRPGPLSDNQHTDASRPGVLWFGGKGECGEGRPEDL